MVTATADPKLAAYAEKAPVVKASYELPRPQRRGQTIKYAQLNMGRTDIYDYIFNRYCPRIELRTLSEEKRASIISEVRYPNQGGFQRTSWSELPEFVQVGDTVVETGETYKRATGEHQAGDPKVEVVKDTLPLLVPDPDVIFVGRLSDGLVWLGVMESRKLFKDMMHSVAGGSGFSNGVDASIEFVFTRDGRATRWGDVLLDTEPGEIRNSPEQTYDTVPDQITWAAPSVTQTWTPELLTDPRYGMHYLKRGDKVEISARGWPRPKVSFDNMTWVLKPPSEGPSAVNMRGDSGVETVGNAPGLRV